MLQLHIYLSICDRDLRNYESFPADHFFMLTIPASLVPNTCWLITTLRQLALRRRSGGSTVVLISMWLASHLGEPAARRKGT